jgi:hypothetical protein
MKLYVFLWESAAADRDDRGWKPLPQGRYFIAGRTAHRAVSRFVNTLGAEFQHKGEDVDSPPRCCYEPRTIC